MWPGVYVSFALDVDIYKREREKMREKMREKGG